MNLDEGQKKKVREWIDQGLKLSDIQKRLGSELGISMTYMELRFLLDDLALKPKDPDPPKAPPQQLKTPETKPGAAPEPAEDDADELPQSSGNVSVSIDQVTRPGAMVSGTVTFSDKQTAQWYLDETGRLGLIPKQQGYKPPQDDLMDFQIELQNQLAKLGY